MIETGEFFGWTAFFPGYLAPLLHVALSPRGGPLLPPAGARCPLGPRAGWFVMVLLLGPVGWTLYLRGRRARRVSA